MRKRAEDMINELHKIDVKNNYVFTFYGSTSWDVRNKTTQEGLYTDGGFASVKRWIKKDIIG